MPRVLEDGSRRVLEGTDLNVRIIESELSALIIAQIIALMGAKRSNDW